MNNTHIIVTGGFDPIHSGHIAYFESAKELGHKLWVGINSNDWLSRKKGQFFLDLTERLSIISNFSMVDHAFAFDDDDNSACGAIEHVLSQVGSKDKKPKQVKNWLNVFNKNFGNATLDRVYIPSFDCSWNFSSSINH